MADYVLRKLIEAVEKENDSIPLWVCVPGAVITGTIISQIQYLQQQAEKRGESPGDLLSVLAYTFEDEYPEYQDPSSELQPLNYFAIVDATIYQNGRPLIQTERVRIALDQVSAWGTLDDSRLLT